MTATQDAPCVVVITDNGAIDSLTFSMGTPNQFHTVLNDGKNLRAGRVTDTVCLYYSSEDGLVPNETASRLCGTDVYGVAWVFGVSGSTERGLTPQERDEVMRLLKTGERPVQEPVRAPKELLVGGHKALQAGDGSQFMFALPFVEAPGGTYASVAAAEKAVEVWGRNRQGLNALCSRRADEAEDGGGVPTPLTVEDLEGL